MSRKKAVTPASPKGLVLDCSIVMAWYFVDEHDDYADSVARQLPAHVAYVPSHWPIEVANVFVMGERRKRSTRAQATHFIAKLSSFPIRQADETTLHAWTDVLNLAREQNLTAYDAAYLELAIRLDLPLATLDEKLKTAATAVGVSLF